MRTIDIGNYFGVTTQTIRRWLDRYPQYFSEKTRGSISQWSTFSETDFVVLATISYLSKKGYSLKEIEVELEKGFRLEGVRITVEDILNNIGNEPFAPSQPLAENDTLVDELRQAIQDLNAYVQQFQAREDALREKIEDLQYRLGVAEGMNRVYSERERSTSS